MPKKVRELKAALARAGWILMAGGSKGSHTKWTHPRVARKLTLSGNDGQDVNRKQERDVENALREAKGDSQHGR